MTQDRIKVLEDALRAIADAYEASAELHTSAADCAANLYDRARAALAASQPAPDCHQPDLVTADGGQDAQPLTVQDAARWQEVALKIWQIANCTDPEDPDFIAAIRKRGEGCDA